MSISTIELSQQHSYHQASSQHRQVTRLTQADFKEAKTNEIQPTVIAPEMLMPAHVKTADSKTSEAEQLTYDKPKTVRLQLMVLVLERFLGRSLDISEMDLSAGIDRSNNKTDTIPSGFHQSLSSISNAEIISIDGQSFQQGDLVSVEQWHSREQSLAYQVQGSFNINDNEIALNYEYSIASEQTSYSKLTMSAEALKDPIIVQYGNQGLGEIEGQTEFNINQDNTLDNLPIFSGDVGYLVFDKNNNQKADDGTELFGPETGQGFVELAQLDSNKNGFIDDEDEHFEQLYIWQPSNDNGITEQWLTLKEAEIQAISLSAINTPFDFYDDQEEIQAQLRQSSFAISESGQGRGVHQVDVRI